MLHLLALRLLFAAAAPPHHDHPPAQLQHAALFMRQHLQSWGGEVWAASLDHRRRAPAEYPRVPVATTFQSPTAAGHPRVPAATTSQCQAAAEHPRVSAAATPNRASKPPPNQSPRTTDPSEPPGLRPLRTLLQPATTPRQLSRCIVRAGAAPGEPQPEDPRQGPGPGKTIGLKIREEKTRRSNP